MDSKKILIGGFGLLGVVAVVWGITALNNPAALLPATTDTGPAQPAYTVTESFAVDRLNSLMWVSPAFVLHTSDTPARVAATVRRLFRPNQYPEAVLHGNSARVPSGWAYIELRNATNHPQPLVIAMPQYRCNRATLYVGQNNPGRASYFDSVGTLLNTTPLGGRFFPVLQYAFPLTLPPGAVLPVLLHTESRVGFHEVDVRLWARPVFVQTAFTDSLRDGFQVLVCGLLALVALLLGTRSANRLLLTYGGYLLSLALAFSCQFGYLNFWDYPAWLSVNAATVGTIGRLLINATFHPFLYELIKPALRNRLRYQRWAIGLCAANIAFMALHLLPYRYYGSVNLVINTAMVGLTLINVGWIVYFSVLAWLRARIWSMLVVCVVALVPAILGQVLSLMQVADWQQAVRQPALHPLLIILTLSYLTFEQFRKQIITKQLLQTSVRQAQEVVNGLRRQEIEGIGRDLHDQVGNTLATALGYLSRLPGDTETPREIIVGAIRELRFLSHNLVKDDHRLLTDKVETLVARINDFAPVQIAFADYSQQQVNRLSEMKQQHLYSILQELLTNIIRHSEATQASVQFFCDGTTVDVSVEDDGIGFDVATDQAGGIGIQNIFKRAALSGIEVRFDAAPTGTSVQLKTILHDANPHDSH